MTGTKNWYFSHKWAWKKWPILFNKRVKNTVFVSSFVSFQNKTKSLIQIQIIHNTNKLENHINSKNWKIYERYYKPMYHRFLSYCCNGMRILRVYYQSCALFAQLIQGHLIFRGLPHFWVSPASWKTPPISVYLIYYIYLKIKQTGQQTPCSISNNK